MCMKKTRIAIYVTGGTISVKYGAAIGAAVPALSGREILDNVPGASEVADSEGIDFGRFPGPHMTLRRMMELSARVRAGLAREDIDGAVVTHGTDTLEETAYLLDLTIRSDKPIAFVGAMRNSSEIGWDGPSNLLSAIRVASSEYARGLGVLVAVDEAGLAAGGAGEAQPESFVSF